MTNLFEEDGHKKEDIEKLYLQRWSVELDIGNLKETLEAAKIMLTGRIKFYEDQFYKLISSEVLNAPYKREPPAVRF
jgi:hypothetical protein